MAESGLSVIEWLDRVRKGTAPTGSRRRTGADDGPLAGEVVVFTGALSMLRSEAADLAATSGCDVIPSVNKTTTLLVVGDQDIRLLAGHSKSSKHRKAEKLISDGQAIRILREADFLTLVGEQEPF